MSGLYKQLYFLGGNRLRKYARLRKNQTDGDLMADEIKKETVTLQELMVSTLAMTDAAVKLFNKERHLHRGRVQNSVGSRAGKLSHRVEAPSLTDYVRTFRRFIQVRRHQGPLEPSGRSPRFLPTLQHRAFARGAGNRAQRTAQRGQTNALGAGAVMGAGSLNRAANDKRSC
jgi:hypothetical protein